ncbi:hypothetical protein [Streptomyces sp. NPDC001388]
MTTTSWTVMLVASLLLASAVAAWPDRQFRVSNKDPASAAFSSYL